jgi:hypothetical protein
VCCRSNASPGCDSRAVLSAGPQLDLPHDATPAQLETLLNGLLRQQEKLPYSFFVEEQQLAEELGAHLHKHKARSPRAGCLGTSIHRQT